MGERGKKREKSREREERMKKLKKKIYQRGSQEREKIDR